MIGNRRKLFTEFSNKASQKRKFFFVSTLVVLETVWVLESVYDSTRQEIIDTIDELLLMPILEFEAQSAIRSFINSARENMTDLSDLLIAYHAKYSGCASVITFDKRAAKLELFEFLK